MLLADHPLGQLLFQGQQAGLFVLEQAAQGHAGPVGDHFGDAADIDVQRQHRPVALGQQQPLL
ncbi:hypothetical protein D3C76_1511260 [compost metagenome]